MNTYFICDDVCQDKFDTLLQLKKIIPTLKVTCFVMGKDAGDYLMRDWIEVGVHGWTHDYPPECERDNQEEFIVRALRTLKKYLPEKFGFRAPGFQIISKTESILKKLGFWYIAHQSRVKPFKGGFEQGVMINTHIYDNFEGKLFNGNFKFLSEGIS